MGCLFLYFFSFILQGTSVKSQMLPRINFGKTRHGYLLCPLKALKSQKDNKNNTFHMRGGKKTQKNYTKKIFMTQITMMVWSLIDILECEVKWALGSITKNKASGGDGIPAEWFQILQDDAVKVLPANMPANLENSAVVTGREKVSFHSNPKEKQCQRMFKLPHNCTHLTC